MWKQKYTMICRVQPFISYCYCFRMQIHLGRVRFNDKQIGPPANIHITYKIFENVFKSAN